MAFSGMSSSGARGRGRWRGGGSMSEMNVVPLVDVMLVLLIIFMVTASAMEFGLEIEVPKVKGSSRSLEDAAVVSIGKSGNIFVKDKPISINLLVGEIRRQYKDPTTVYVRADKSVRWDLVAQVLSTLGQAKLAVNAVTKTETIGK
ncbi:MAG: biopolymer transporter ExbD [Bryobacteraceae bacterium]